jgi:hypothetical protein
MDLQDAARIARQRLLDAGLAEAEIPALMDRATQLVAGLAELASLDQILPEPALIWQPAVEETQ